MFEDIRRAVSETGFATREQVAQVESFAEENESPIAFALLGDLIQLLRGDDGYDLADAEKAYLRAIAIDPAYGDGYVSLGFFYDCVMNEPATARSFFERAVALGAEEADEGLRAVLEQLGADGA